MLQNILIRIKQVYIMILILTIVITIILTAIKITLKNFYLFLLLKMFLLKPEKKAFEANSQLLLGFYIHSINNGK